LRNAFPIENYFNGRVGFYNQGEDAPVKVSVSAFDRNPFFVIAYFGKGCEGGFARSITAA